MAQYRPKADSGGRIFEMLDLTNKISRVQMRSRTNENIIRPNKAKKKEGERRLDTQRLQGRFYHFIGLNSYEKDNKHLFANSCFHAAIRLLLDSPNSST